MMLIMFIFRLLQHRLPIEDGACGAGGEAAVRAAEGAAKRGVGEPICEANWGHRAALISRFTARHTGPLQDENPLLRMTINRG